MTDVVGQTLGQYRVMELIGQGGMARVYKGFQPSLARYVAIKAIPTQFDNTRDNEFAQRFITEARVIARLTHPNIVPVHDYGEDKGWAFIVMEYISGGTLRNRIATADAQHVRLDLASTLDLLAQAALALECAHTNGIIHRDVKPANMLLRTEDHLLLSDFGIAALLEANRAFTRTGANIGTPQYMAPEQGTPNGVIDARTDIYALGVVTFQCVTGQLPFPAESPMAIVMRHIKHPVPRPSTFVPGLPHPRGADYSAGYGEESRQSIPARPRNGFTTQRSSLRGAARSAAPSGHGQASEPAQHHAHSTGAARDPRPTRHVSALRGGQSPQKPLLYQLRL